MDMHMLLYFKRISNQDLLYSAWGTGESVRTDSRLGMPQGSGAE